MRGFYDGFDFTGLESAESEVVWLQPSPSRCASKGRPFRRSHLVPISLPDGRLGLFRGNVTSGYETYYVKSDAHWLKKPDFLLVTVAQGYGRLDTIYFIPYDCATYFYVRTEGGWCRRRKHYKPIQRFVRAYRIWRQLAKLGPPI